jgi:hypothetical protein
METLAIRRGFSECYRGRRGILASYLPDADRGPGKGVLFWCDRTRVVDLEHELRHVAQDRAGAVFISSTVAELEVTLLLIGDLGTEILAANQKAVLGELARELSYFVDRWEV